MKRNSGVEHSSDSRWKPLDGGLALLAVSSIAMLLTAIAFRRIWGADFWWQYKTGEYVASHGPPTVDVFSFTSAGAEWIEMRWLYCYTLFKVVQYFGLAGAVVGKWLIITAAFGLVTAIAATARNAILCCAVLLVALLASSQRFFVRPELVTYLFLALFLWIIARYQSRSSRLLYALPFLQILWVNSHTLFILGPVMTGLLVLATAAEAGHATARAAPPRLETPLPAASLPVRSASGSVFEVGGRLRALGAPAAAFLGTILACLVNPYGLRGLLLPLQLFREITGTAFKASIGEFMSPFAFAQSYTAVRFYVALIVICIASALLNVRRLKGFETLLLVALLYLSLTAIRNLPLFCLAAVPFAIGNISASRLADWAAPTRWLSAARRLAAVLICGASIFFSWELVTDRFNVRQHDTNQFGAGLARHRFPEMSTRFLLENGLEGPVFNTMFEGSYLLAHGVRVFIDPRLEVHGESLFRRYLTALQSPDAWQDAVSDYDLKVAFVEIGSTLVARLAASPEWSLATFDEVAAVFVREDLDGVPAALSVPEGLVDRLRDLRAGLPRLTRGQEHTLLAKVPSPASYLRLAGFLLTLGHHEAAAEFASDALAADPRSVAAHGLLARAFEQRGDFRRGAESYRSVLRLQPRDAASRFRLGLCLYQAGELEAARAELEASVVELPSLAVAWAMLTKIHASAGRLGEAIRAAERAVTLAPGERDYLKNLGRLYAVRGDSRRAIAMLERARMRDPADPDLLRDLAATLMKAGESSRAAALIERGLASNPGQPDLLRMKEALDTVAR